MLVDHIGEVFFPNILVLRIVGRISFPIFAFLIVEGYFHSRNLRKYFIRLGFLAIISEIPFDLTFFDQYFFFGHQNIFFTLFNSLIAITIYDRVKNREKYIGIIYLILLSLINTIILADYVFFGVLIIFGFYQFRQNKVALIIWVLFSNTLFVLSSVFSTGILSVMSVIQFCDLLAFIFIFTYNGKKGLSLKYVFYLFYPMHLLLLYFIENKF